jgi:hypothetical protein
VSTFVKDYDRVVIPRWRDLETTLRLGELAPLRARETRPRPHPHELQDREMAWRLHHTIPFATDLLSAGFVVGATDEVRAAARFVLQHPTESSTAASVIARRVLGEPLPRPTDTAFIKQLRALLNRDPRNTLHWVELARLYASNGGRDKAIKAMRIAVALSPNVR